MIDIRRGMLFKMIAAVALSVVMITSGCSNSAEVEAELKAMYHNIPADASMVVSGDLKKIVEQTGGKVEDGKIVATPKLDKIESAGIQGMPEMDMKAIRDNMEVLSAGIEAGAFAAFIEKGKYYTIFTIRDLAALKAAIDKKDPRPWEKYNDIEFKGEYYIMNKGQHLWVSGPVDLKDLEQYAQLSEVGSFLGNGYAEKMSKSEDAFNMWMSLDGIYSGMSFSQQAQARMAMSMLFEGPKYLVGGGNFRGKGLEFEAMPVTADYSPAKCVIEVSKIDPGVVSGLGGNANRVVAMNVSQKLVGQIKDFGKSMGGAVPAEIWNLISPIDGTVAGAMSDADGVEGCYKLIVTTNGKEDASLAQFMGDYGKVKVQGTTLTLLNGNYGNGKLVVGDVAKKMKDAWFAAASVSEQKGESGVVYLMLVPAEGTLKIKLNLEF